ncbi:unnamed protein product [Acanthoscelides obtectus]|uniref:Uncharacterized protein n=1 Tax=Acanthoscelides obtectus TaxID=200917 RepID=A0A9P0QHX4_ACAOB|nr:unnamed protein product [Acanthoscelides obtectus]CAK1684411.1 hypothetical protein AOBTE_LOCUS34852 [Acanthoscelides obtectus]
MQDANEMVYFLNDNGIDFLTLAHHLPTIVKSELQMKLLEKYNTSQQARQFTFSQITCHDVMGFFRSIKSNALGVCGINLNLTIIFDLLIENITFIINYAIASSNFPNCWKKANVLPLAKISNPTDISHLRPIIYYQHFPSY